MAKTYNGIEEVIQDWENLIIPGRFYGQERVTSENIAKIQLVLYGKKDVVDYVNEMDDIIPEQLTGKGFSSWIDSATFQAIIDNKLEHAPEASQNDLIGAIFYYLENDAFMHD